MVGIQ